eukprot:scaffold25177_cov70-Attheya_sp.AAC.2
MTGNIHFLPQYAYLRPVEMPLVPAMYTLDQNSIIFRSVSSLILSISRPALRIILANLVTMASGSNARA